MPAVSVIIPTYDRLEYLKEAVQSVFAQTCADWELIVIDDGSTDGTNEWLDSVRDSRVVAIREPHSGFAGHVRNVGIARARAKWIAFLDSDDRWLPDKLTRQLAFHEANPAIRWSYTGRTMIGASGEPLPDSRFKTFEPHTGNILRRVLLLEANIALPTVMVDRALLREAGGFHETWGPAHDFELWLRLAERAECATIDEPLAEIRKHRAESFQWPSVSLAYTTMLESFARRSTDTDLQELALTQAAYHAVNAADRLALQAQWSEARSAIAHARRLRPRGAFTYRASARLLGLRMRALFA